MPYLRSVWRPIARSEREEIMPRERGSWVPGRSVRVQRSCGGMNGEEEADVVWRR
jgi:hypothetical protein